MEKEGRKAVLLTDDGSFQRVKLKKEASVSIGQSVFDSDLVSKPRLARKLPMVLVACFSAAIFFWLSSQFINNKAVAAYVSFDVNPSIEAALNEHFRVISVKALNDDGKNLLAKVDDCVNMPFDTFTAALTKALASEGYLENAPELIVSTIITDEVASSKRARLANQINSAVKQIKTNRRFKESKGTLEVIHTTMDRRKEAEKAGLSTGKYMIYLEKGKENPNLKLEDVKHMTLKELHQVHLQEEAATTKASEPTRAPHAKGYHPFVFKGKAGLVLPQRWKGMKPELKEKHRPGPKLNLLENPNAFRKGPIRSVHNMKKQQQQLKKQFEEKQRKSNHLLKQKKSNKMQKKMTKKSDHKMQNKLIKKIPLEIEKRPNRHWNQNRHWNKNEEVHRRAG